MPSSVISANPQALFEYSLQTMATNEQLRVEASHLTHKIEVFVQRCSEYRIGIDVQLAHALQAHTHRAQATDQWVGEVGRNFERAGAEGSLNSWVWAAAQQPGAAALGLVAAAKAGAQWLGHAPGHAAWRSAQPVVNTALPRTIQLVAQRTVERLAVVQTRTARLIADWLQNTVASARRWIARVTDPVHSPWQRLRSLAGWVAAALGRGLAWNPGANSERAGFQARTAGASQWVCSASPPSLSQQVAQKASQLRTLAARPAGIVRNGIASAVNFIQSAGGWIRLGAGGRICHAAR